VERDVRVIKLQQKNQAPFAVLREEIFPAASGATSSLLERNPFPPSRGILFTRKNRANYSVIYMLNCIQNREHGSYSSMLGSPLRILSIYRHDSIS
jgi:hypothetical protein